MLAVAADAVLNQAVAEFSANAYAFLCAIHNSTIDNVRARADAHMHQLREFARTTGAVLHDLPAYTANITSWRAIARLAGTTIDMRSQAG